MNKKSLLLLESFVAHYNVIDCPIHFYLYHSISFLLDLYNDRFESYDMYLKFEEVKRDFDLFIAYGFLKNHIPNGFGYTLLKKYLINEGVLKNV